MKLKNEPRLDQSKELIVKDNRDVKKRDFDQRERYLLELDGQVCEFSESDSEYKRKIADGDLEFLDMTGDSVNIVVADDLDSECGYESSRDFLVFGRKQVKKYLEDLDVLKIDLEHEMLHRKYLSFSKDVQEKINNEFVGENKDVLCAFAKELYNDKYRKKSGITGGESYLRVHRIDNKATKNILVDDDQIGLKDWRTVEIEVAGEKKEVLLGLLVSELLSYFSSIEMGDKYFLKAKKSSFERRGMDDKRYLLIEKNAMECKKIFIKYDLREVVKEKVFDDLVEILNTINSKK